MYLSRVIASVLISPPATFPQFDRNPNTGDPLGSSARVRIAQQTIYHGGKNLSHIVLPVVPALTDN